MDPLGAPPAPAPPNGQPRCHDALRAVSSEPRHEILHGVSGRSGRPRVGGEKGAAQGVPQRGARIRRSGRQLQDYEKLVVHPSVLRRSLSFVHEGGPREQRRWVEGGVTESRF